MSAPTVDILMATYNGGRYVAEQIASIENQTHQDWRLLVSDDCSQDDTLAIVGCMAEDDERIEIASSGVRHGGAAGNFMSLVQHAEAPYVMFADQDDAWLPEKVGHSVDAIRGMEERYGTDSLLLAFCDMRVVDDELNTINDSFIRMARYDVSRLSFPQLIAQNVAAGCTMIANRPLVELAHKAPVDGRLIMHDWWLMLVAAAFGHIEFVDEALSLYRQHGNNEVGANSFSPADRARHQDFMEEQFRDSIAQAELFAEVYGGDLSASDLASCREFINVGVAKTLVGGLSHLMRSRCLKAGARKLGQLAMVARVAKANRASGEAS